MMRIFGSCLKRRYFTLLALSVFLVTPHIFAFPASDDPKIFNYYFDYARQEKRKALKSLASCLKECTQGRSYDNDEECLKECFDVDQLIALFASLIKQEAADLAEVINELDDSKDKEKILEGLEVVFEGLDIVIKIAIREAVFEILAENPDLAHETVVKKALVQLSFDNLTNLKEDEEDDND